jgi:predicted ATPase/predicted negative regulator of RcsB-dependent stress response
MKEERHVYQLRSNDSLADVAWKLRARVFSSQVQAAQRLGINRSTILRYENGGIVANLGYLACLCRGNLDDLAKGGQDIEAAQQALAEELNDIRRRFYPDDRPFKSWQDVVAAANRYLVEVELRRTDATTKRVSITPTVSTPSEEVRSRPTNWPVAFTSFIGRESERAEIKQLLSTARLVTLTGAGGSGKTRLALEVGTELLPDYADGVWLIELASVAQTNLMLYAIASALGVNEERGQPILSTLSAYLQHKQLLLVLDNFEHLVDTAPLLTPVLADCPNVHMLVTSREPLSLREEWVLVVGGLPIPTEWTTDGITTAAAGQLFIQRAEQVRRNSVDVAQDAKAIYDICRMVEGLPLAIEIAAAWTRLLTCAEIAQEIRRNLDFLSTPLRNVSDRHRSLRAVFDYSWHLLDDEEKRVFRQLGLFRGGFRLEAAATVVDADLMTLASLVDKSLLQTRPGNRYGLHTLLYKYTQEKLAEETEEWEPAHERHLLYFTTFLSKRDHALLSADPRNTLAEIDDEIENVRAAWGWALANDHVAKIEPCMDSLESYYDMRGRFHEGEEAFAQVVSMLDIPDALHDLPAALQRVLGRALGYQGAFCARQGRLDIAVALLRRSLEVLSPLDAPQELAYALLRLGATTTQQGEYREALRILTQAETEFKAAGRSMRVQNGHVAVLIEIGMVHYRQGDRALAQTRFEESLALAQKVGNGPGAAYALFHLGTLAHAKGDLERARALLESSVTRYRELEDRPRLLLALNNLGCSTRDGGNLVKAQQLFEEEYRISRAMGDTAFTALALGNLGSVALHTGDYTAGRMFYEQALALYHQTGHAHFIAEFQMRLGELLWEQGDLAGARARLEESITRFETLGDQWFIAVAKRYLSWVVWALGDSKAARLQLEASLALSQAIDTPRLIHWVGRDLGLLDYLEGNLSAARAQLDNVIAWQRTMTDTIELAQVLWARGLVAASETDYASASTCWHETLTLLAGPKGLSASVRGVVILCWLGLAGLVSDGKPHTLVDAHSGRLTGAAARWATDESIHLSPLMREIYARLDRALPTPMDNAVWDEAYREGERLTWEAVTNEALAG